MTVLIPASPVKSTYTQDNAVSTSSLDRMAILCHLKFDAIDFQDNVTSNDQSGLGFSIRGGSTNNIALRFRTSAQNTSVGHPVTPGDFVVILTTIDLVLGELKHYVDGVQIGSTIDVSGHSFIPAEFRLQVSGSTVSGRNYEFKEWAVWNNTIPAEAEILDYVNGDDLDGIATPPTVRYEPVGSSGQYVPEIQSELAPNLMKHNGQAAPTSGGLEPVYAGAVDSLSFDFDGRVLSRSGRSSFMLESFTGSFTGKTPGGIEYRVFQSPGNSLIIDWTRIGDEVIGANVWSGIIGPIPIGDDYVIQIRDLTDPLTLGSSVVFNVGIDIAVDGQSNATRQYSSSPTVPVVPNHNCFARIGGAWVQPGSAIMELANRISDYYGGISVGLLCEGQGATDIEDLEPGSALWDNNMESALASVNNQVEAFALIHGENNAGGNMVNYRASLDNMKSRLDVITGRDENDFVFLECQTGTADNSAPTSTSYVAIRETQKDWAESTPGVKFAATTTDAEKADFLHYTDDWYVVLCSRIAKSYANYFGLDSADGVGADANLFTIDGNQITVAIDLRGNAALVADAGTLTGWEVFDSASRTNALTISDVSIVSNNIVITTVETPDNDTIVDHIRRNAPDISNIAQSATSNLDDIGLQMITATEGNGLRMSVQNPSPSVVFSGEVLDPAEISLSADLPAPSISFYANVALSEAEALAAATVDDVRTILPAGSTLTDDQIQMAINAAQCTMALADACMTGKGISDECKDIIETYLAAHYAACTDNTLSLKSETDACCGGSATYGFEFGEGIKGTPYGQNANTMSGGCLAELDKAPVGLFSIGCL